MIFSKILERVHNKEIGRLSDGACDRIVFDIGRMRDFFHFAENVFVSIASLNKWVSMGARVGRHRFITWIDILTTPTALLLKYFASNSTSDTLISERSNDSFLERYSKGEGGSSSSLHLTDE